MKNDNSKDKKAANPNLKSIINKIKGSKLLTSVIIILAAAALVSASVGIANYSKTAYLRPYKEKYPDVSFPQGIEERFCDYYGQHPDTVGYIEIPDVSYSEYILSENNNLNPMLDSSNIRRGLDFNTVVYLNSPQIDLEGSYAACADYLKSTQKVTYSTLFDSYEFNIIGAFYTNSNPADDMDYCFPYNFTKEMTQDSLDDYTDRLYHRFLYNSEYKITNEDKLITICIKSDFMPDFLFVAVGVLDGEKQSFAENNSAVHYPQIWYDKNKKENIYRFASKWYPEVKITDKNGDESVSRQTRDEFIRF